MAVLRNRWTGGVESADVVKPIEAVDVDCFTREWAPILNAKIAELKATGQYTRDGVAQHNVEDAHWEWTDKVADRSGQLEWNSYAIRCGGRTQGLMFANMLRRCRLTSQLNEHMVYVDLVATAPWNRPNLVAMPLYRGVGAVLMTEAILESHAEGFGGRIGLHALPRAEPFYRDEWRMEALGPDPKYLGLHYFEMTLEKATEFLQP